MPRETVLQGFATPPPNARCESGVLPTPTNTAAWQYFRLRNNSATSNIIITSLSVSRYDGYNSIPLRIETVVGNPVDAAGIIRWLDMNRAGTPNVNAGSAVQTSYPFAGLATSNQEVGRIWVDGVEREIPFPLVLPPATNLLIHTMSRGAFRVTIYFFALE